MGTPETFTFSKGLNLKRSPLFLEDGELVACEGFDFPNDGEIVARTPVEAVNSTAYGSINGIHRYINYVYLTYDGTIRGKWDLNGYCDLYTPANGNFDLKGTAGMLGNSLRPRFADYNEFTFILNGLNNKVAYTTNVADWGVANPTDAPVCTDSGGGSGPSGTYSCYYTWLVKFPNGRTYETGPSPAATVTLTDNTITWTGIQPCPYKGSELKRYRKLYRTSDTLIDTYYVTTIADNSTTTYTDSETDATLQANDIIETEDYQPPPSGLIDATDYLQRIFATKANMLYWSEPYIPFAFPAANGIAVARDGEVLQGIQVWGEQLYIPTTYTWYRLQGQDSATWAIKNTFAEVGIINRHTLKKTRYGLVGLWYDGIYLFNGMTSKNITLGKLDKGFFSAISSLPSCYAEWDGIHYFFHYPVSGTTISKCLVLDFSGYPNLRCYHSDFVPTAFEYHTPSGIKYFGSATGYQYKEGTTDTIALSLQTGDRAVKNILKQKQTEWLWYDINTAGEDVTLIIYADGVAQSPTYTLNHATRTRKRISLASFSGYRFSIALSCADGKDVVIYEPWTMSFNEFGV